MRPSIRVMDGDFRFKNKYSIIRVKIPIGMLRMKQKRQPQGAISVKTPPRTGPMAAANAQVMPAHNSQNQEWKCAKVEHLPTKDRYRPRSLPKNTSIS